jgi:hypothetical protein
MDLNEMVESWMTSYMSREMMLSDVLRLWGKIATIFAQVHIHADIDLRHPCRRVFLNEEWTV